MKKRLRCGIFALAVLFFPLMAFAVPAVAERPVDAAAAVTTVEIVSGDKTVATLEVPAGERLSIKGAQAISETTRRDGGSTYTTLTITGNVVIEVVREGKSVLRIRTEKAVIRTVKGQDGPAGNPADVTTVPQHLAVMGAVNSPGPIAYVPGMTLAQAIEQARGATASARLGQVEMVRVGPDGKAVTRKYNLADPKDAATPIQPGDWIKVPMPMTRPRIQPWRVPDRVPQPGTGRGPLTAP